MRILPPLMLKTKSTEEVEGPPRAGRCALVGRPNVGKSTLLNALVEQKLAITAPKPQTTRTSILGVFSAEKTQIAFIDTPGLHRPKNALGRALVETAKASLADADVVVLLADTGPNPGQVDDRDEEALAIVAAAARPTILAINKVDRTKSKEKLLPLLEAYSKKYPFDAIVPISALKRVNLDGLIKEIRERLPEGVLFEDPNFLTDRPERFFAAEFVREAILRHTRQEVPHSVMVVVDQFLEGPKTVRVEAVILVEKESQKKIVIGARGSMLKTVGTEARLQIEEMIGRPVFLELFVKVAQDWTDDPARVREAQEGSRA